MEEFDIMYSSDKTVRLTNKRIIFDNDERQQEIMLEDYTGYSFKKQNIGNFGTRANILGLLTILLFFGVCHDNVPSLKKIDRLFSFNIFWTSAYTIPFFVCGMLFLISLFYFLIGRRRYLEIKGKYNSVTILVTLRQNSSIKRFVQAIEEQRNKLSLPL